MFTPSVYWCAHCQTVYLEVPSAVQRYYAGIRCPEGGRKGAREGMMKTMKKSSWDV